MPLDKLIRDMEKAMEVELNMGCLDTAVMGGFSSFVINCANRAEELMLQGSNKELCKSLRNTFAHYLEKDRQERRTDVLRALKIVDRLIKETNSKHAEKVQAKDNDGVKGERTLDKVPLQYLKNVGPKRGRLLNKMGIFNALDLIYHIPRRYEDRTTLKPFHILEHGEVETVKGIIVGVQDVKPRRGLTITKAALRDEFGLGYAVWFNQPFVKKQLVLGRELIVSGKVDKKFGKVQITVSDYEVQDSEDKTHVGRIVPVYPVTEGLPQRALRNIIKSLLENHLTDIKEVIPATIREAYGLMGIQEALESIHFPLEWDIIEKARQRIAFEELLILQLGLAAMKLAQDQDAKGIVHKSNGQLIKKFYESLPFSLTEAQIAVLKDIFADMEAAKPMNRLLQGDVGSGKTIVSAAALVKTVENGYQGILMAPTEILAEQHYQGLQELFGPLGIRVSLLTGSLSKKDKDTVLQDIRAGNTDVIIGTHAIIQDGVEFNNPGLVITDEQHRFGVKQRAKLQDKGVSPDVLVMTATPIPRTLSMTVYGDLDVSVIDQLPPGRSPVQTFWVREGNRDRIYEFVKQQVAEGRQAYFVCPLVEESEKLEVEAAVATYERLAKSIFPDLRIGLLHGRMKSIEKEETMEAFRLGEIDILVATTVIEVGVNVPNATVMIIEDAGRFGLAQLHQLRGRVGRGTHQSYCILIADPKTEDGKARMEIMRSSTDGFRIAEEDLKLRGPGDLFGTRQSGLPDLKIADIVKDIKLLEWARKSAFHILQRDPKLSFPEHLELKNLLLERFNNKYKFINIS